MMFTSCSLMMTNWDLWPLMFMEMLCWWQAWKEILIKQLKISLGTCIMKLYVLSLLNHPIKCCCTILWLYLENPVRNMAAYRKSNKKNTHRKKTQFKKGHQFISTLKESCTENYSSSSVSVVQRPSSEKFADALSAQSTCECDVDILPAKLRPVKIEDAMLCCKIKLCSEQKILYFVNAQLLWESLMMPVWLNCNKNKWRTSILNNKETFLTSKLWIFTIVILWPLETDITKLEK